MAVTIDISTGINGLWTLQDNPAAGTSEVRDPNGALFTSFAHPADSVTLLSRAGQNVTVNLTEALGTASLIIGSLTSTTVRPDQIFVNRVSTSGNVTLTANQAITEAVGDVGNDIVANQLLLDAGTGIGTSGNPIETQVLQLEGESVTGGIHLSNVGDLTIGGSTAELRGLFTGISGNIALTNSGSIFLADVDNVQSIAGKGDITLTAIGAAADITSIVNNDALFALGDLNLSAGRDILFGTGGLNFDNDVRAGGAIFVTAGDDFHIDGNADMLANDAGTSSNGGIQILVGGDILIEDGTGTSASVAVTTGTGGILLATGAGGTLSLAANSAAAVGAGAGGVVVSADRVLIEADSGITTTGNGAVTITGSSASRNIILGSATDAAAAVELSDAELDRLFTQNAIIGTSLAGQVAVQAAITHPNANLTLQSESDVLIQANISSVTSLTLRAGDTVTQNAATTITTATLNTFVDTPDLDAPGGQTFFAGTVNVTSSTITGNTDGDFLSGTNDDDTIVAGAGSNFLDGNGGVDTADYGAAPGAVDIDLDAGGGDNGHGDTDTLVDMENLVGSAFADELRGSDAANRIDGSDGADEMEGRDGDDTYIVDDGGDTVIELAGEGFDTVRSSVSYTLSNNVERLILTGSAVSGTGNGIANILLGNNLANMLNGAGGADTMRGSGGDDTYFVDDVLDQVFEVDPGDGFDTVRSSVTFGLGSFQERLILTGASNIDGNGNTLDNILFGNIAANQLNGGQGADQMRGGDGDDTYIVDNAGDQVFEISLADGTDTVRSSVSFSLGSFQENLVLTGVGAIDGNGNTLVNNLTGNGGNNQLNGGAGADTMTGGGGDDTYTVDNAGDTVVEAAGGGTDLVKSGVDYVLSPSIENLTLTGSAVSGTGNGGANTITGSNAANTLSGGGNGDTLFGSFGTDTLDGGIGNDKLYGGASSDDLTGGTGLDGFHFDAPLNAAVNVDDILDFTVADDTIRLDRAIFTGIGADGAIGAAAFRLGTSALDADDRILYDSGTGQIRYDADGIGGAASILFATVTPGTALTSADFFAYT